MADQGQKTEKPTRSRLAKARKEGRFATSRDLVASVHLVAGITLAFMCGQAVFVQLEQLTVFFFARAFSVRPITTADLVDTFHMILVHPLEYLMQKAAFVAALTMAVQLGTTGLGFSTKNLVPNIEKFNFIPRVKGMPKQNFGMALKALALLPIVSLVLYLEIYRKLPELAILAGAPLGIGLMHAKEMVASLLRRLSLALLILGFIDYARQRQKFNKELKMSKQEIKDEMKDADGDPQVKVRIRRLQREAFRRSMMKAIPKATVVVVNPTHYAIALAYEMNSKSVPTVVAKGKNYLAQLIRQRAMEHEIPIVENKPLAQALYQAVDVGQEIPSHLYRAVAEVLAYIYRTMNRR